MREDEGVDPTVERFALALRRPVDLGPEVDRAVMAAIRAAPLMVAPAAERAPRRVPARRAGAWSWLVRPRSVRLTLSPLGGLAAAGIAVVAALFGLRREAPSDRVVDARRQTGEFPTVSRAATVHDTVVVQHFFISAPTAKQVALVGDFNDWDQQVTPLTPVRSADGMWSVAVKLPPGVYSYAFLIDGKDWKADPVAPRAPADDFGRPSSVITVAREGMSS